MTDQNLVIDIADRGIGIPADALDSIFDRFVRVDAGRSRDKGGSGLGFAITRSVVAAHGGSVDLTSSSAGTTARIYLPTS